MNSRRHDIAEPSATTCTWLSEHPIYHKWFSEQRGLLWIKGNPGTGKSTLMRHTYEIAAQDKDGGEKSVFASFFFHGRGSLIQKNSLGLFRSLLHQLGRQVPRLLERITSLYKEKCQTQGEPGVDWHWHERELRNFFKSHVPNLTKVFKVRLYIDALDESGKEVAVNLVEFFEQFTDSLSVCFSCRYYPLIALAKGSEISVEDKNARDIDIYTRNRTQSRIEDKELEEEIRGAIVRRSSGIFQWTVLVADNALEQYGQGRSRATILEGIKRSPSGLNALYADLLRGINEDDLPQSLHLMQWVCFAFEPLSITELRFAMLIHEETACTSIRQCQETPEYVEEDEQMERNIRYLSKGLIEIVSHSNKRVAQFIHQSINDYLLNTGLKLLDSNSNYGVIGRGHFWLSRSCIKYLSMEEIKSYKWGIYPNNNREDAIQTSMQAFPFLNYSTNSWVAHAAIVEDNHIPQDDLVAKLHPAWKGALQPWIRIKLMVSSLTSAIPEFRSNILHIASTYDLPSVVEAALDQRIDINARNIRGQTPLHCAASEGIERVVKLLLEQGAEPDLGDKSGKTPLFYAAVAGEEAVARFLLARRDVDVNSKDAELVCTPLSAAVDNCFAGVVELLLNKEDIEADLKYDDGATPLHHAVANRYETIVRLLLDRKDFDVNSVGQDGHSPLTYASYRGYEQMVNLLLARADIDVNQNGNGHPALFWAAVGKSHAITRMLQNRAAWPLDPMQLDLAVQYSLTRPGYAIPGAPRRISRFRKKALYR